MSRLAPLFLVLLPLVGCGEDEPKDTADTEDTAPAEDTGPVDECSAEALREDALTNGEQVMNGLTLEESTPIADLLADPDTYDGQPVQAEGTVVEVCDNQGCWANLNDGEGNLVTLKVEDGTYDFREGTEPGYYAVGEGIYDPEGSHGPSLLLNGAMLGTVYCE